MVLWGLDYLSFAFLARDLFTNSPTHQLTQRLKVRLSNEDCHCHLSLRIGC